MGSGLGSLMGSGVGSLTGSGVGSLMGLGLCSLTGSGVGSLTGSGVGSLIGSDDFGCTGGSMTGSGVGSASAEDGCSSALVMTTAAAAATAVAAVAAAAIVTSLSDSVTLGPRFTGVGVLLPTVFFGLVVLAAAVLEVLGASLEAVVLLSGLGRVVVLESTALLVVGFFVAGADFAVDFGTSCLVGFGAELGRAEGDSADFLAVDGTDLVTSFFTGAEVLDVCDADTLPAEGVVGLEVAGFDAVEGLGVAGLGVAGLGAAPELLVVLLLGGRVADVPEGVLVVLETGGLSGLGEAAELGFVAVEAAGLDAAGFLAAAVEELVLTPLVAVGVFLAVGVAVLAPLVRGVAEGVFFSPVFGVLLGVEVVPVGFLGVAVIGVLFLSEADVGFLGTPLVWGLETPLERRLGVVFDAVALLVGVVPGLVFVVLLGVLDLASPEGFLLDFAGVSLEGSASP